MTFYIVKKTNGADSEEVVKMILEDEVLFVPKNPENRHWQIYQAWLAEGNVASEEPTQSEGE